MGDVALASFVRGPKGDTGATGNPGAPGPAGPTYEYTQTVPSNSWLINHNLGFRPAVDLYSVGGVQFDAQVTHMSVNQVIVTLTLPAAGTARLT